MRMIRGVEHDTGKVERIWSARSRGDRIMWRRVPRPAGKRDLEEVKSTFLRAVVGLSCSKVNSKLHQGITNN